jgi:hypothetical protein
MPSADVRDWFAEYLMSRWAKDWLFARSKKTSGQRNINARTCGELPIPVPPEPGFVLALSALRSMARSVDQARNRAGDAGNVFRAIAAEVLCQ